MRLPAPAHAPYDVPPHLVGVVEGYPRLLTIPECSELLRLSPRQLRRLISTGRLRAQRAVPNSPSARVLVAKDEVLRYLVSCCS